MEYFPDSKLKEDVKGTKAVGKAGVCTTAAKSLEDLKSLSELINTHRNNEYVGAVGKRELLGISPIFLLRKYQKINLIFLYYHYGRNGIRMKLVLSTDCCVCGYKYQLMVKITIIRKKQKNILEACMGMDLKIDRLWGHLIYSDSISHTKHQVQNVFRWYIMLQNTFPTVQSMPGQGNMQMRLWENLKLKIRKKPYRRKETKIY